MDGLKIDGKTYVRHEGRWKQLWCGVHVELATQMFALLDEIQRLRALHTEIVGELYGKGFQVAGWHLNSDLEELDAWFDDNDWCDIEAWKARESAIESM